MATYLKQLLFSAILVLTVIGLLNYFIDPFHLFQTTLIEGINANKSQAQTRDRIIKAYQPATSPSKILLIGNSRVGIGLDPEHPAFTNKGAYNLGLPGADLRMQAMYANNAIQSGSYDEVIIGIDFIDFIYTARKDYRQDVDSYAYRLKYLLDDSSNSQYKKHYLSDHFIALFSLDAFKASFFTLLLQHNSLATLQKNGHMTDETFHNIVQHEGIGILFKQKEDRLFEKFTEREWLLTPPGKDTSHFFVFFNQFINSLYEKNIKVTVFINPYHQNYSKIIIQTGMNKKFQRWKKLLVDHLSTTPYFKNNYLWDFSTLNKYTTEPLPGQGKKGQYMKWYWEPAHYRKELGDHIINTIYLGEAGWGSKLTPDNYKDAPYRIKHLIK